MSSGIADQHCIVPDEKVNPVTAEIVEMLAPRDGCHESHRCHATSGGILYTRGLGVEVFLRGGEAMSRGSDDLLAGLPEIFRYSEAMGHLSERKFRRLIEDGDVVALSRGLYRKSGWLGDVDLIEIAAKAPLGTLCLASALARHDLIDDIPAEIDVAVPRGSWTPRTAAPVRWRHFDPGTFGIGRESADAGAGRAIGMYSAERSIIDAFRMRHLEGGDLANEALKRWLRQGGQPSELLGMARSCTWTAPPDLRQSDRMRLSGRNRLEWHARGLGFESP